MHFSISTLLTLPVLVLACADHAKRSESGSLNRRSGDVPFEYDQSYNWHTLSDDNIKCQTGTQQSPINLSINGGLSSKHNPQFDFGKDEMTTEGYFYNWGWGPAFNVNTTKGNNPLPKIHFDDQTLRMVGWHIHAPGEHTVDSDRSKAELHIVWGNRQGDPGAVTGIRLDPGRTDSAFAEQFISLAQGSTQLPRWDDEKTELPLEMDFAPLLGPQTNYFAEFWTYEGSLTSPPCTEGLRWYVARSTHFVSDAQMQAILAISAYSTRTEQEIWLQNVNA